jgi:uncharacterized protein YndB with AHSA1/START domain
MTDLNHSIPINASPAEVYATIATQTGMQGWWTKDTVMAPKRQGRIRLRQARHGVSHDNR